MDAYQQWNDALAERFFNPAMGGRNVYLYVNQTIIGDMEQAMLQATPEARTFWDAIAGSLAAPIRDSVCRRAFQLFNNWRASGAHFPPYIGYLCFFVFANDIDGDFAPHAYYPRLRGLLFGEQNSESGTLPSFDLMRQLWDDLEDWSVSDQQGELGIFQSRSIGGNIHIGYPLSQSILAEQDRLALPQIFYNAGLDPALEYTTGELATALCGPFAAHLLRARTVQMARGEHGEELYKALYDTVADELAIWDGTSTGTGHGNSEQPQRSAGLRVCIDLDRIAGIARTSFRCKMNCEFPEAGILLEGKFLAEEDVNQWSLPLKNDTTGQILDASRFDWQKRVTMQDVATGWRLSLQGRPLKIFTSGMPEGINGLVDTPVLPQGQPFYLCYHEGNWPKLEQWVTTQCHGFQEIETAQGLPVSWRLARVGAAVDDTAVRDKFPSLAFPRRTRIRLVGGIRHGSGNRFFNFALPAIAVTGGPSDTRVYYGNTQLPTADDNRLFALPGDLPTGPRITLEARSGQSALGRQSLFLSEDFGLPTAPPDLFLDITGTSADNTGDKTIIAGAYIYGGPPQMPVSQAELFKDLEYELGNLQGLLVGRQPGQIVAWPSEPFPLDWTPEWVIRKHNRRRLAVVFVGNELGTPPADTTFIPTRRKVQDWKQATWHRRKRIMPPRSLDELARWRQLLEVARNVR